MNEPQNINLETGERIISLLKYRYSQKENRCWIVEEIEDEEGKETLAYHFELLKMSETSDKTVFQYPNNSQITLTIETLTTPNILSFTLRNVIRPLGTIWDGDEDDWEEGTHTMLVWDDKIKDYREKENLPLMFNLYMDANNEKDRDLLFYFDFYNHLVQKDRDQEKPWFYYRWDWSNPLADFVYQTVSPYINKEKEVVSLPSEMLETLPWEDNDYEVNDIYENVDMFYMNKNEWEETYGYMPGLVISYLPTYFKNYTLPQKEKLTGTTWLQRIMDTFPNVPLVLKCYRGFVFVNLFSKHPQIYEKISAITELPPNISARETGGSNLLVYFNLPQLGKGVDSRIPWDKTVDIEKDEYVQHVNVTN